MIRVRSLAHRKMEFHLCAGKYTHMFSSLVYAVITLASLQLASTQSVTASTSGLVVDTNRNSRSVNVTEVPGLRIQLELIVRTEDIENDLSGIRNQPCPRDLQAAYDQSEGHIDSPSNQWLRTRWSVGRKVLSSQRIHGRMLASPGQRSPPGGGGRDSPVFAAAPEPVGP